MTSLMDGMGLVSIKDPNMPLSIRVVPQCIKHYPGAILDVVLSTTVSDGPLESTTGTSSVSHTDERPSAPTMTLDLETEIVQRLASSLTPEIQTQLRTASNGYDLVTQVVKNGQIDPTDIVRRCFRELEIEMTKNMELSTRVAELSEKKGPQTRPLDQIASIQRRIQSLLTRNYDLHESLIPRLFVALPIVDPLSRNLSSNTFRLYFLCDCGDHTMSTDNKTSHCIHLDKHEGYDITHPEEFFQEYGLYVLTMLQMLKFGISEAGVTVPSLSHCTGMEDSVQFAADQHSLVDAIELGIDLIIGFVEKIVSVKSEGSTRITEQAENNDGLENVDIHQLGSFLRTKDEDRLCGNLYRTATVEGYAKWMCIDHYHEKNQEMSIKALHDMVKSVSGSFDENVGRVRVNPRSRNEAEQLYTALEKATAAYDLKVDYSWVMTHGDLKRLRDALARTNVRMLELDILDDDDEHSDSLNRSQLFDPLLDVMRHPQIQSVTIPLLPWIFFKRSSLPAHNGNFPNLRHLDIGLRKNDQDLPGLKSLVARAPNLSSLVLRSPPEHIFQLYDAVVAYQTYPISLSYPNASCPLRVLPLTNEPLKSATAIRSMTDLLNAHGGRIEIVELSRTDMSETTVAAFAKATESNSCLKELTLAKVARNLGKQSIKNLAGIVARSELRRLEINLEGEEERAHILESVHWKHIRELAIVMDERSHGMRPLKAVVDGIEKLSRCIAMEEFQLCYEGSQSILSVTQELLLRSLVASVSLKRLRLSVFMTVDQVLSLLKSTFLDWSTLCCCSKAWSQLKWMSFWMGFSARRACET